MEMNQWTDQTDTLSSSVCQDIGYRYTSLDGYQKNYSAGSRLKEMPVWVGVNVVEVYFFFLSSAFNNFK